MSKPGIILLDVNGAYNATLNIYYSCSNLTNVYNQDDGSSSLTSSERQDTTIALNGIYKYMSANDNISGVVVFPIILIPIINNIEEHKKTTNLQKVIKKLKRKNFKNKHPASPHLSPQPSEKFSYLTAY